MKGNVALENMGELGQILSPDVNRAYLRTCQMIFKTIVFSSVS